MFWQILKQLFPSVSVPSEKEELLDIPPSGDKANWKSDYLFIKGRKGIQVIIQYRQIP